MPPLLANGMMLLAGLFWGGGFIAQETAMRDIGPFLFVGVRFLIAALAVLPLLLHERRKRETAPSRADVMSMVGVGLVFFTAMMLQQVGLLSTSVTNAGMLTGLYVVLVPIIALVLHRVRQPGIVWPCAAFAFLGIWMLGGGGFDRLTWGDWTILVSAVFAAFHVIVIDRSVRSHHRPVMLACVQFATAAILGLIGFAIVRLAGWEYEPAFSLATLTNAAPELLYAALIAGALAFTIMAVCQQYTAPAPAAILLSSEALFAALGGALLLGDRLDPLGYAGCVVLFTAIVTVAVTTARADAGVSKVLSSDLAKARVDHA
ncbi:DMT family transporter [Rhizobiaceae bacterium]|nr:DMT family transporter [Rhizobiaceae bacterium]